jgi:hypothetical protein
MFDHRIYEYKNSREKTGQGPEKWQLGYSDEPRPGKALVRELSRDTGDYSFEQIATA